MICLTIIVKIVCSRGSHIEVLTTSKRLGKYHIKENPNQNSAKGAPTANTKVDRQVKDSHIRWRSRCQLANSNTRLEEDSCVMHLESLGLDYKAIATKFVLYADNAFDFELDINAEHPLNAKCFHHSHIFSLIV
uniref:Uncharacterized protein n=1 Tax=Glossina austeni TaxID=7395 RepID=A0A1A9VJ00_GLOAU